MDRNARIYVGPENIFVRFRRWPKTWSSFLLSESSGLWAFREIRSARPPSCVMEFPVYDPFGTRLIT